jgi:hypothetical protein
MQQRRASLHRRIISAMKRSLVLFLAVTLLLMTAHRLPAPISEESPTPAPEQSAKPKPKRAMEPRGLGRNLESPSKRPAPPTPPRGHASPQRNPFVGTWRGTINIGWQGDVDLTITISETGTVRTVPHFGDWRRTLTATSNGPTMTWKTTGIQTWTLTPNSDGQTAVVTGTDPGALVGLAAFNSSAVFHKTSP